MKILHLTLKKEWFIRHLLDKTEDYRAITPYWIKRLMLVRYDFQEDPLIWEEFILDLRRCTTQNMINSTLENWESKFQRFDIAEARNGYGKNVPMFQKEFIETTIGIGDPDWGAPEYPVFIIRLGKVVESVKPKE